LVKTVDGKSEGTGILGDFATRLQEGFRATLDALGVSHAQRLAAIVESSDDAILSVDLDGVIATWNGGAQRLFGYEPDEIIGKPVTLLIPAHREGEELELLGRLRHGKQVDHYRTERRRKDGKIVEVSLTLSPLKDSAGTTIGASKIARDITALSAHARSRLLFTNSRTGCFARRQRVTYMTPRWMRSSALWDAIAPRSFCSAARA
jgi:PAS domain S-box-containing protein